MRVSWDMTSMRTGTRWRSSAPAPELVRPRYILAHYPPDLRLVDTRKGGGEGLESAELRESLCTPRSRAMRADLASPGFSYRLKKDKTDFSSGRARHRRPLSALDSSIGRLRLDLSVGHVLLFTLVLAISPGERRIGNTLILAKELVS